MQQNRWRKSRVSVDYWFMSAKDEDAKKSPLIVMVNERQVKDTPEPRDVKE